MPSYLLIYGCLSGCPCFHLLKIKRTFCFFIGKPRQSGSSHKIYKTPWHGDPRVNIQNYKGKAKAYQVKQVLKAIERLEVEHGT